MARILLGISGSVTAYKGAELAREFIRRGHQVRAIITSGGQRFITPLQLQALTGHPVQGDQWRSERPDGIDHIFLARWADMAVYAILRDEWRDSPLYAPYREPFTRPWTSAD